MSLDWTKMIELYLQGELSPEDSGKLLAEVERNPKLKENLDLQKKVHEIAKRSGERQLVKKASKSYHLKKTISSALITVLVIGVILVTTYILFKSFKNEQSESQFLKEMNVKYSFLDAKAELENLPISYFEFDGSNSVFLSPKGILLSVTENTFLLNGKTYSGKAVIQLQEALDASDFLKAGLSTKSGDKLLETQGMFGLKAFTPEGKPLTINNKDGLYMQLPVDSYKKNMQLFNGVKLANGEIDWQNPKPIEKLPIQANMLDLDLYPPGYEKKLNDLKWKKSKKERDSLYLSFEPETYESEYPDEQEYSSEMLEQPDSSNVDGNFMQCCYCHESNKDGTGPKLKNIRQKWNQKGVPLQLLYEYVRDWKSSFSKHPYMKELSEMTPTDHNNFPKLSNSEIDEILDLFDTGAACYTPLEEKIDANVGLLQPSKVLAIWKKEFNGTILATKDFEKRMKAIHKACDRRIFEIYSKQLNKPLWELDEEVVALGYPEFQQFADEHVGSLDIDNAHLENLKSFYEKTSSKLKEIAKSDNQFQKAIEKKWNAKVSDSRNRESIRTSERASALFYEEANLNLNNVLKQLGKTKTIGVTIRGNGQLQNSNVYNIDRYVLETTIARKTSSFYDKDTGKTATITYNDLSATIKNANRYSKIYLYLFPSQLSSFERIIPSKNKINYSLNANINYDAVFVGINDEGYFILKKNDLKSGNMGEISLSKVSEAQFENTINSMDQKRKSESSKMYESQEELDWIKLEVENYKVEKSRIENKEFRFKVESIIFPCNYELTDSAWK